MSLPRIPCPTCRARLAPDKLPAKLQCPKCGTRIIVNENGQIAQSKSAAVQAGLPLSSGSSAMVPAAIRGLTEGDFSMERNSIVPPVNGEPPGNTTSPLTATADTSRPHPTRVMQQRAAYTAR